MNLIVPDAWKLPTKIRERFGDNAGRQRAMLAEGHLLLVLHDPPGSIGKERTARLIWRSPSGLWVWNQDGDRHSLLKKHLIGFSQRLELLERRFHQATCADDYFELLQALTPLHRTSRHLHEALQQARDMVPADHEIIVARDEAADIERAFELLCADAKNGLDYTVAKRTELQSQQSYEMAAAAHRLNMLAALFLPVTALSSVFGMNLVHGAECFQDMWLFWGIIAAGFVGGLLLTQLIGRKAPRRDHFGEKFASAQPTASESIFKRPARKSRTRKLRSKPA
jgi:hypothetical protein